MQVSINAHEIQNVLNADVINIDNINQIKKLSTKEQNDIIKKIIETLEKQSENLMNNPNEIISTDISKLAESTNKIIKDISKKSENIGSEKHQVFDILKNIKNCLGSTSDILFNAIKIAQILGVQ